MVVTLLKPHTFHYIEIAAGISVDVTRSLAAELIAAGIAEEYIQPEIIIPQEKPQAKPRKTNTKSTAHASAEKRTETNT